MSEKHRKIVVATLFAFVSAIALASSLMLGAVLRRVRQFDCENQCDVLAGRAPKVAQNAATEAAPPKADAAGKGEDTNRIARVEGIFFSEPCANPAIIIKFSRRPKSSEVLHYASISPKVENLSVEVESDEPYPWRDKIYHWVRIKSGNFRHRTPYVVTVSAAMPFEDGGRLGGDVRRTVVRPDLVPSVSLAAAGRYLPPIGEKAVDLRVVNVSKVECAMRTVLPENIVQLLAREEGKYSKSNPWWRTSVNGDSDATTELAAQPTRWTETIGNEPNVAVSHRVRLGGEEGAVSNGVYLLSVRNGDLPEGGSNEPKYRLICLTDMGLSVRRDDYGLRIWVTSLTTGRPLAGLEAAVYAANRLPLARGETNGGGEATLTGWDSREEPFALVVTRKDGSDAVFMALGNAVKIDETLPCGVRPGYVADEACSAFVWTDRGIYRHGESIMVHSILRTGRGGAPRPFPVVVAFEKPDGHVFRMCTRVTDESGAVAVDHFSAPGDQPSGMWKVKILTPGKDGVLLGERTVKVEDFVPPQVRVSLKGLAEVSSDSSNVSYRVCAEHLFGGAAKMLTAESLVAFVDEPFSPSAWKGRGFRFGDPRRGLKPNYTRIPPQFTDDAGEAMFSIGMKNEWGLPQAAVRVIVQGSVLETGGRPAVTRASGLLHFYPCYLGSDIPRMVRLGAGAHTYRVAAVAPDGKACPLMRRLKAELWKIESVYNLVRNRNGTYSWDAARVRHRVMLDSDAIDLSANGEGEVSLPATGSGDYEFVVTDEARNLSHCAPFWVSASDDDEIRASLKNPASVALTADRPLYRAGDRPRLTVKSPFRGSAWIAVMRDKTLYTRTLELTNLTSVVELDPVDGALAPNIDVAISVVQSAAAGGNHLAARAHGLASLAIRPVESEISVSVASSVRVAETGGSTLDVRVLASGLSVDDARAVVTVVDEGINLLTSEPTPDPIGFFSSARGGNHPLFDLYGRLLPVCGAPLRATGVKTGGDGLAELMNRVSPVASRRFRPLALWRLDLPLTNGVADLRFELPEFVGETRVTALVYTPRATGCASVRQKVCPKLVLQPDAPRFSAPEDSFDVTLTLSNRSGKDDVIDYGVSADGAVSLIDRAAGRVAVRDGASHTLTFRAAARPQVGEGTLTFRATGCGENRKSIVSLPIRPAVPWRETAGVVSLRPGETWASSNACGIGTLPGATRRTVAVSGSPAAELVAAFDYLAEYPHGCLEQTTSRMFPLIVADDVMARLPSERTSKAAELKDIVADGIARVTSMLRSDDFTMWPDCNCPPWDREVSLYAAHFLVEAGSAGHSVDRLALGRVRALLKRWAHSADTNEAAYACHTLAVAGAPEKDRTFALYEIRDRLPLLSRARLARAFVRLGDPVRAHALLAESAMNPTGVKESAFALLALQEMDANDPRLGKLVAYLQERRDRARFHWGTTGDNAHALLALAAYYRLHGMDDGRPSVTLELDGKPLGERLSAGGSRRFVGGGALTLRNDGGDNAFVSYSCVALPEAASVTNAHRLVTVSRRFVTTEGRPADLANLTRGELLISEITLAADRDLEISDLVVQELLPAGLEPDRPEVAAAFARARGKGRTDWVLRSDTRDDRTIVFSRPLTLGPKPSGGRPIVFYSAVRAVTAGDFILPGVRVEAMYAPDIFAQTAPSRISVKKR